MDERLETMIEKAVYVLEVLSSAGIALMMTILVCRMLLFIISTLAP